MDDKENIIKMIHKHKLLTIQEHDQAMEEIIATGSAVEEVEPKQSEVIFSGIGCSRCSWKMIDLKETKTDPDNKKYRQCICVRCGNTVWRRTP